MSLRPIDLSGHTVHLPDPVIVDAILVVARLLAPGARQNPLNADRATNFFEHLISDSQQVILTPTAYSEVLHASIRIRYEQELRLNHEVIVARFGRRITSWIELYKHDPSIARQHVGDLKHLRQALGGNNVAIATPAQLGVIRSGRPYDEELIRLIGRYGLDTNDALILMEASRLGITAIVTMDRDMQRALPAIDIYTWQ